LKREEERKRDAFARVCFYILMNPLRTHLINESKDWPYAGAVVPGYPSLCPLADDFWPLFWKLYLTAREPDLTF
jgi:hypothetical protein